LKKKKKLPTQFIDLTTDEQTKQLGITEVGGKVSLNPGLPSPNMEQASSNEPLAKEEITGHVRPVLLHIHSKRHRLTDSGGASDKYVVDSMVEAGFFIDDSPAYIKEISHSQEKVPKDKAEETIITITGI